jgi:hypothetical protein
VEEERREKRRVRKRKKKGLKKPSKDGSTLSEKKRKENGSSVSLH